MTDATTRRTTVLLALLVLVAGAAVWVRVVSERDDSVGTATPAARVEDREPLTSSRPAEERHPRVDDQARILAPFGPRLGRMADDFYKDLGIDIHVVTQNEGGSTIESQADKAFRDRKIGAMAPTGGLLVILNPAIQKARIEVGYSLEGGLTDLHMGRIARDQLAPYASYAIAGMAVMDVLHYLRDQVYLSAALGNIQLGEEFRKGRTYDKYERFVSGGAGAKTALSTVPMDADLKRPVPADKRSRYAPSANMKETVAAFLRATADLAGDPTLELFTEGSRLMRAHYPLARFEELERLERIDASLPLEYIVHGDYAVATSRRPVTGFVPVLLHREQGLWRIDLVETWKNLFFDKDGNYFLRNSNTPYASGLTQFGKGRHYYIAPVALGGDSITEALARLEGRQDALSALWRAEIWLRNAFLFPRALSAFEEALRAAPEDPLVLQVFGNTAMYLGFPELAIPTLEKIGRGVELTLAEAYNDQGNAKGAGHWVNRALEEDPYDWQALHWRKFLAEQHGTPAEVEIAEAAIAAVAADPGRAFSPVVLQFNPLYPKFNSDTTVKSDGVTVYDHSQFRVTMTNTSNRPVELESVRLTSEGTAGAKSGLGDIRNYWRFPAGKNLLLAGESIYFDKLWGFTVDTKHEYVRYTFRLCWHGVGTTVRQCRTRWVDAMQ
ncbi:MAG: TPM domain-containing protein [Steroidobacteraceae bacterium]